MFTGRECPTCLALIKQARAIVYSFIFIIFIFNFALLHTFLHAVRLELALSLPLTDCQHRVTLLPRGVTGVAVDGQTRSGVQNRSTSNGEKI